MIALAIAALVAGGLTAATPRFYPDDPIQRDDDRAFDASGAKEIEGSNAYDFSEHTFFKNGERRNVRAMNINTIGEVPDSSWFTNRIGRESMPVQAIVRGANQLDSVNIDGWPIVQEKSSGITPGFRIVDPSGRLYQLKFDPPSNPEMASGAEMIGAALYHAFGYNVVQGYIVEFDPAKIVIAETATTVDMRGRRRPLRREDVDRVLRLAARQPNGKYRALASRFADGRSLGFFRYYGTRPDDPNDVVMHEHRRELRGNRVFGAWLNHDDSRGLNTLDMLEGPDGKASIRHYMFDFGSIMGSGSTTPQSERAGNEYILEWEPAFKTLFSLGLWVRPWIKVDYPKDWTAVGNFEADFFDPVKWRPEYPNPAFDNMRPDDAFWAARIVAKFSDDTIRAVVQKAQYSEPGAADYIAKTLIARRNKVVATWLTGVNPVVDPVLDGGGVLTFGNAAVDAGVAAAPSTYEVTWSRFDNAADQEVGSRETVRGSGPRVQVPAGIAQGSDYLKAEIVSVSSNHPEWAIPVSVYFRRQGGGWQTVGLERLP